MAWFWDLDLIRFFEFYLVAIFLVSTAVRLRQYFAIWSLVRSLPGRWPRLLGVIREHQGIFLTWTTVQPAVLALALVAAHTLACRLVWPQARVTLGSLLHLWPALPIVLLSGLAMTAFDIYTVIKVSEINREQISKYFDQAEYWLGSRMAPVLRAVTFGYIDPRRMVSTEVQKALHELNRLLNSTLWWVSLQTSLRIVYGLALWLTFAFLGQHPANT